MSLEDRMFLSEDRETIHIPLLGLQIPAGTVNVRTTQGERTARRAVMDIGFLDDPAGFALATKRMQAERRMEKPAAEARLREITGKCFKPYLIQAPDGLVQMVATAYWDQKDEARNTFVRGHEYGHGAERLGAIELLEEAIERETGLKFQLKGYRDEVVASIAGLFALHRKGHDGINGFGSYTALDLAKAIWAEKAVLAQFGSLEALGDVDAMQAIEQVALARKDPYAVAEALATLVARGKRETGNTVIFTYDFSPELNRHTPIDNFFADFERAVGETRIDMTTQEGERVGLKDFVGRVVNELDSIIMPRSVTYTLNNLYLERGTLEAYLNIAGRSQNLAMLPPDPRLPAVMEMVASLAIDDYDVQLRGRGWRADVTKRLGEDRLNLDFNITEEEGTDELEITIAGTHKGLVSYFFNHMPCIKPELFTPLHTSAAGNMVLGRAKQCRFQGKGEPMFLSAVYTGGESSMRSGNLFSYFFPSHTIKAEDLVPADEPREVRIAFDDLPGAPEISPIDLHVAETLSYASTDVLKELFENGDKYDERTTYMRQHRAILPDTAPVATEHNKSIAKAMEEQQGARMAEVGEHWKRAFYDTYGEGALVKTTFQTLYGCRDGNSRHPRFSGEAERYAKNAAQNPTEIEGRKVVELGNSAAYILLNHSDVQMDREAA